MTELLARKLALLENNNEKKPKQIQLGSRTKGLLYLTNLMKIVKLD